MISLLHCVQQLSVNIQSKFGDILIITSRDSCDKADTVPFGEASILTIFNFGEDPKIIKKIY